jgi:putative endonuclease
VTPSSEQAAAGYLTSAGFRILGRAWGCPECGTAIVAADRDVLVICPVTARPSDHRSTPLEPVSRAQQAQLRRLAASWLAGHGVWYQQVRIDVLSLTAGPGGYTIEHLREAG